jgi:hypothetical protein
MVIILGLLQFYFKQNRDLDPSKQTILKMAYIGKVAYNIGRSTIHSGLAILLKKSINDLKPLGDEKCDALIKQYTQLKLLVLDEISLINS